MLVTVVVSPTGMMEIDKLVFETFKLCCHCEERSDVAIPRLEQKCTE